MVMSCLSNRFRAVQPCIDTQEMLKDAKKKSL
jgi:hypothetical protein